MEEERGKNSVKVNHTKIRKKTDENRRNDF